MLPLDRTLAQFPFETPRPLQTRAIRSAWKHFDQGKRFVVLELPTGVGKSAVGLSLAKAFDSCFYITVQKILQDQYAAEFKDAIAVLKGRNAYQCWRDPKATCADGLCTGDRSLRKQHSEHCPYTQAASHAVQHPIALLNMDSFYYQRRFGWFREAHRDLLVVDEGHLIENKFFSFIEVRLQEGLLSQAIPTFERTEEYTPFLQTCLDEAQRELKRYENATEVSKVQASRLERLAGLEVKLLNLLDELPRDPSGWVHQIDFDFRNRKVLMIKPVFVHRYVNEHLFAAASKVLVMSATILSVKHWCESVGVDRNEVAFIRSGSPFPKENRPIELTYAGSMSRRNVDKTIPRMLKVLRTLLDEHAGERGIIHTHSYKLAKVIRDNIFDSRLTFKDGDVQRMMVEHGEKPDSVIVAPGLAEGLDLKDDLSRFQIILKVPYPSLGDKQMKRRFDLSKGYYNYCTLLTLVQEYGRSVRHQEDKAVTYIVDQDFERFRRFTGAMTPQWFAEAIREEEE